jgi:WD40 repeat protein
LTFLGHTKAVLCVAISTDGSKLASGSADNTVRFWDVATGKEQATLKGAEYGVDSVAFSPDGKTLASGAGGNKVMLWDVATRKGTTLYDRLSQYASPLVAFSPDGKTLASGGRCISEIRLWNVNTRKQTATLKEYDVYGVIALTFTPDNKILPSLGVHDGIKLWDAATGKSTTMLKAPDRERIEKLIRRLGNESFREREKAARDLEAIGPMALDLVRQAVSHRDPEISRRAARLVDLLEERAVTAHSAFSAAFSPDGKTLATPTQVVATIGGKNVVTDRSVKLWDVATGKEQATLKGHTDEVRSMTFSPDGRTLAFGGEDGTIKLLDVAKDKTLATLKGHKARVVSLVYSADGKMLISGSADKSIKLWDMVKTK